MDVLQKTESLSTALDWASLKLLLPHGIIAAVIVLLMLAIAIKRNHFSATLISTAGLISASVVASIQLVSQLLAANDAADRIFVTPLFAVDSMSVFFVSLLCFSALAIAISAYAYFSRAQEAKEEFQLLLLLATLGAITLASANHFASVIIGLEMLSMALYGMIAYRIHMTNGGAASLEGAIKYLVLSAVATATMLFGTALIYAESGTLVMNELSSGTASPILIAGFVMLIAGVAFKLSLVPFQLWTPDVYQGGPLPAVAFLATLGKVAVVAFLIRLLLISGLLTVYAMWQLIALVAVASIIIGNLLALRQTNLKRLLAFSSVAHMGYLLVAILSSSLSTDSFAAALLYITVYSLLSLGAFSCISMVSSSEAEVDELANFAGLFWRDPWLAAAMSLMMFGLAGIPLTAGFIAKFKVFFVGVSAAEWGLLIALIVGSVIGLFYYLRVIFTMLMQSDSEELLAELIPLRIVDLDSTGLVIVIAATSVAVLLLGVYPEPVLQLMDRVATGF